MMDVKLVRLVLRGFICLLYFTTTVCSGSKGPERCDIVKNRCMARVGCGMALQNFILGCNALMYGELTECTVQCTRALISLLSTDDKVGVSLINCDCGSDEMCKLKETRIDKCTKPVLEVIDALNDSTVVKCNLAVWLCEADAACQTALMYHMNHCGSLMEGVKCTSRCNNSLAILHRQTKASKLINCTCDGDEECINLRRNTERLCFNKHVAYKLHNSSPEMKFDRIELFSLTLNILVLAYL